MNYSQIGLILDITGVLILFQYGLPSKYRPDSENIVLGESDEERFKREKANYKIKFMSRTGLVFLIVGFLFQFIGSSS
jgi:hypothetical protein